MWKVHAPVAIPHLNDTVLLALCETQPISNRKRDGQGYRLVIGPLCDVDSQQLMPGGVAILFAWGHPSTNILKKGQYARFREYRTISALFVVLASTF